MEKRENSLRAYINILSYGILILFSACKAGVEPIDYGNEACAHCKMTIVDYHFAAEMITSKGKVYKFDDVNCMRQFAGDYTNLTKEAKYYVSDFGSEKGTLIDAANAIYLKHEFFTSPMNGNAAAFLNNQEAKHLQDSLSIQAISWNNL
ncbi:MAG: nitrous oxide reductase accessory protein NosL [Bacteroidetes bacterium]|nr:nitrous oxide reductase accessory protein NosL [Bacteroidota bacterium]